MDSVRWPVNVWVLRRRFSSFHVSVILVYTLVIAMFVGCAVVVRIAQRNVYRFCKLYLGSKVCSLKSQSDGHIHLGSTKVLSLLLSCSV